MNMPHPDTDARKIIHLDMDCFYAAVEQRDHPDLNGKPVAVGGSSQRGVLTTCNYIARKFGIHSAMPVAHAYRLCPQLVVMPVRMDTYQNVSQVIHKIMQQFSDIIEPLSLDEAYLDVSDSGRCDGSATLIARQLRACIQRELSLTASAGIAPNKLIAKIASDWRKPNGQFTVAPHEVSSFMAQLPLTKIWGIGRVTAHRLHAAGFFTATDLLPLTQQELVQRYGRFGQQLFHLVRGVDTRPVRPSRAHKSISVETTFEHDLIHPDQWLAALEKLLPSLESRLISTGALPYIHKCRIKIRHSDFSAHTAEATVSGYHIDIFQQLLRRLYQRNSMPIRLLGCGVALKMKTAQGGVLW